MWKLKEGSVTLCLDGEGRLIKLGQGGYGSIYLVHLPDPIAHVPEQAWHSP